MTDIRSKLRRIRHDESGATAVEYAVMMALILLVCFASIKAIGSPTTVPFTNAASSLGGGS
jgi:pilus assembly protein Flp/PilA